MFAGKLQDATITGNTRDSDKLPMCNFRILNETHTFM